MPEVNISIQAKMHETFANQPNTHSNALADFIDNSLQSYRDSKNELGRGCQIKIKIDFDENKKATRYTIHDNAGGIDEYHFKKAFMIAERPDDDTGLHEFGAGMKTAALWLGKRWKLISSAYGEKVTREFEFDLHKVVSGNLQTLPYKTNSSPKNDHFTEIIITQPTKNTLTQRSLPKIKRELASRYRNVLRTKEVSIVVNSEKLEFNEYKILEAPYYKTPDGPKIKWKKDIDISILGGKYRAKGFIALLNTIKANDNGIALFRRGRVVLGANEDVGPYMSESLVGKSTSSFIYKRLFGELELEGFSTAMNKNDILEKEELEEMMKIIKEQISKKEFNLYGQGNNYRLDDTLKIVNKLVEKHEKEAKKGNQAVEISVKKGGGEDKNVDEEHKKIASLDTNSIKSDDTPSYINGYDEKYVIDGVEYTLTVKLVDNAKDLFYVEVNPKNNRNIICCINASHIFFDHFGKVTDNVVTIFKSIALARLAARKAGEESARNLLLYFNKLIKEIKI